MLIDDRAELRNCTFDGRLLYSPGKNRCRPALPGAIKLLIWREWGYRCAICLSPGVEIHHIVPWRESLGRFGEPHLPKKLISLCPACHAKADHEEITRQQLEDIKELLSVEDARGLLSARRENAVSDWVEHLSLDEQGFLSHLRDWHRTLVYKGHSSQFRDYLNQLYRYLRDTGELRSAKGLAVLAGLASVLRRDSSSRFKQARWLLETAQAIAWDLKKTRWVDAVVGRIHYDLGYISFLSNDYTGANTHFDRGIESDERAKQVVGLRITKSLKELARGRQTGYCDCRGLSENLAVFCDQDNPDARRWVTNCRIHLAEFFLGRGDANAAIEHLEAAQQDYDRLGLPAGRGKLLHLLGTCYMKTGEKEDGILLLSAACAKYRELRISEGFADVCFAYGQALEVRGRTREAIAIYRLGLSADSRMDNISGCRKCLSRLRRLGVGPEF